MQEDSFLISEEIKDVADLDSSIGEGKDLSTIPPAQSIGVVITFLKKHKPVEIPAIDFSFIHGSSTESFIAVKFSLFPEIAKQILENSEVLSLEINKVEMVSSNGDKLFTILDLATSYSKEIKTFCLSTSNTMPGLLVLAMTTGSDPTVLTIL